VAFTNADLQRYRGVGLPDTIGPDTRLLIVGVNPGLHTAAVQAPFSRRGNRFYPALYRAGIVDRVIDASTGFRDDDRKHLLARGVGITALVNRATARADELDSDELVAGAAALGAKVQRIRPRVVAILGITAYRVAFTKPKATVGRQLVDIHGAELWVVPNPSGLNAHESAASLGAAYRSAAVAAGIPVYREPSVE
jgi:double-stranded uracil-DNA glycosylase